MANLFKVLVVDDEPGMRSGIARILNDSTITLPEMKTDVCFSVTEAESAEHGLELIESQKPDILLLDHKLPGMSGLELLVKLTEKKIDILTVMMTAYASLETAVEATKNGAYDFLAKPFSPAELKHLMRKASSRILYKRQAQSLAEEKKKLRFEFISVLAHELKSPLAAIQGYLNIIRDRVSGEDIGHYDAVIDRSLIRLEGMKKLIFDLLDMTRIESEQRKRDLTDVNLNHAVKKSVDAFALSAKEHNISVHFDVPEDLTIKADVLELDIMINNLVSNAIKYNRPGGKVDISVAEQGPYIVIKVCDTGIGMKEEEQKKLFKDFVRIRNEQTRNIVGSGLGLSTVNKLVQLYDGKISVHSEFSKGSCFTVELLKNSHQKTKDESESSADKIMAKTE
ncbi:MAG: Alkaline phosphatase synthesis sensor protein PhoR [Planctomycetes bacterium ADurb.Bin401]|nr:MAG: Alkaline phosphatase synthesis sensor protein PhoR [Planctomycetes bacterium ADurb.Bin401]